ncbi:MAG TPA: cytochrome-c oxidase, cbb3-type subunit III [Ideonella sp.]|uniref:cytochrome-c oxidase, cbb3-type subunit III n=1 Tax=Ideonella sp. TaxID=1929293 RepID=UPI002D047913|nr:cytochrome-c oxidase, cbb3-type subunit III [Ideonella sp.]HSI49444.1 cytochrome-c oxidase, cbb3-type subunit III [Ideonella sp.]
MSDFINAGWGYCVAAVTVLGLVACIALLLIAARRRVMAQDNTTGHVWDEDLRELNNPLPRWWMWLFILTVVFGAGYLALYPGLGSAPGQLGWSSVGQYQEERAAANAVTAPMFAAFAAKTAPELARDPQAMAVGERLFANNCAACHGSDAHGSKGFPNLADQDWLWGGAPERIEETIRDGRMGVMPPMVAAVGNADEVHQVANYVLSLSGSPHDSLAAQLGKAKFVACAACHGPEGKGNQALGVPNLSDKVWLHGWGEDAVVAMINKGKTNVMPAHGERLTAQQIHLLAAYVWSLSKTGTVTTAAAP